jgi:hypothetical protein
VINSTGNAMLGQSLGWIVAGLVQRVPELEATPEAARSPETASGGTDRGETSYPRSRRSPHSAARGCIGSSSGRDEDRSRAL